MTVMPGVLTQGYEVRGGWTPPNHHAVLDSHLTTLYEKAKKQLEGYETALVERKRKAALLSDGKKMENGHPCVNFVYGNEDGTMYCANVDTFGKSKTGEWYAEEIKKIIERTGNSVPLVLLDSAGECDKARKILRKWCKTLTAGACATHTLDLLFDDICKLDRFKKMLGTARVITKVVRNHTKLHAHYVENGGTAIDKWSDTRQVAAMYMVLSLKRNMPKLVALVLSDVFKKWGQSKHKRKTTDYDPMQGTAGQGKTNEQLAGIVQKAVQSTEFWQEVDIFITVLEKIYATLRANDSEVPGTPDIYFRMSSGLADLQTNEWELPDGTAFKFSPAERKVVLDAYKQRWDMLYNRLHALGLVLNPLLHSKHKFDGTCMVETRRYIDAYFASESDKAARCHQQLDNFRDKKGEFHGDGAMWSTYLHGPHRLSPISWWRRHAIMSRELLEIAECSLPMPTSIGSSERVWKVFAWIQCKKRNRLEQERASQLAHVHWSLRYHSRQADPCYEEVILPDVTENPMYSTDDVWQGANSDISDASNSEDAEDEQEQHEHEDQDEDEDEDEHARLISFLKECN